MKHLILLLVLLPLVGLAGCDKGAEPVRSLTRDECMANDQCREYMEQIGATIDPIWVKWTDNGDGTAQMYVAIEAFGSAGPPAEWLPPLRGVDAFRDAVAAEDCDPRCYPPKIPCRCRGVYDQMMELIGLDCECDGGNDVPHSWLWGAGRPN